MPVRLEQISRSTKKIVEFLKQHPKVEVVIFPFDESFPQYELARQQMAGAGGLLTFILKTTTFQQIEAFCEKLQHILMAVSWGGHESLIIPKIVGIESGEFNTANKEHRMLRMYVGLEDPDYLIHDLEQAFSVL